jgi:hypothetical protein
MNKIIGSQLNHSAKAEALRRFVYRFTGDHKPAWASKPWKDGRTYPLQFKDDADWLANTYFCTNLDGSLSAAFSCCKSNPDSNPTWPNDPGLRRPNLDIVIE